MTAPFMRAYTELLVRTCHKRGAHAMGGMAAFIPSRRDPRGQRDGAGQGARRQDPRVPGRLRRLLGGPPRPGARSAARSSTACSATSRTSSASCARRSASTAADLLAVAKTPGEITEAGLRNNISVGLQYLATWLAGNGAVAIFNLMEDAATAEISRSQIWQWLHNDIDARRRPAGHQGPGRAADRRGARQDPRRRAATRSTRPATTRRRRCSREVALADDYADFLTLPAYERMP